MLSGFNVKLLISLFVLVLSNPVAALDSVWPTKSKGNLKILFALFTVNRSIRVDRFPI